MTNYNLLRHLAATVGLVMQINRKSENHSFTKHFLSIYSNVAVSESNYLPQIHLQRFLLLKLSYNSTYDFVKIIFKVATRIVAKKFIILRSN